MTDRELVDWANAIVAKRDHTALLVFADALEEAGDVRAVEVRRHALCCSRGLNIADHIGFTRGLMRALPAEPRYEDIFQDSAWSRIGSWPCVDNINWPRVDINSHVVDAKGP